MIPGFESAIFSTDWKDAYEENSSRERHDNRGGPSRTAKYARDLRTLATRYSVNPKTILKWKKLSTVADLPTGPRQAKSSPLSAHEEAIVIAIRRHILLPFDDCLYALQPTIPRLTRSSLHRRLNRHGVSRSPDVAGDTEAEKKFRSNPIGFVHIDSSAVTTKDGRLAEFHRNFSRNDKALAPAEIIRRG